VNQDDIRCVTCERLKARANRGLTRGAAIHRRLVGEVTHRLVENIGVVRVTHRLNREHVRMRAKWLHRP
jgi:hypothetical protein